MKYHFTLALLKGWTTHILEEIGVTGDPAWPVEV